MLSNQAGGNLIGPNDFSAAAPRKGQREQGQAHSSKEKFQIGLIQIILCHLFLFLKFSISPRVLLLLSPKLLPDQSSHSKILNSQSIPSRR